MKNLFYLLSAVLFISAQDGYNINTPASYKIGQDEITMNVNLWGHVQKSGSYDIPIGLGLLELISNAGGPTGSANIHDVKIVRKNGEIVAVNIKQYIETGDYSVIKQLQPGDLVIVGGSLNDAVRDFFGYLRDIGILLNAIILANRL
jgi:NADH:ubiquinone oxidoreductase subunit F (NADH-binding)